MAVAVVVILFFFAKFFQIDIEDCSVQVSVPSYNEEEAKMSMNDCNVVARMIRNINPDDEDWQERIPKWTWSPAQQKLFECTTKILDSDRLARLAIANKHHEPVHRRAIVDRSVDRLRKLFASVAWEAKLTQWLHSLLQDHLPPSYLAIYMDILQKLKVKVPSLTDRLIFDRPGGIVQEFVGHVLKKPWEPQGAYKQRQLPGQPLIVIAPSAPHLSPKMTARMQEWFNMLTTMGAVVSIQVPLSASMAKNSNLQSITEQMIFVTRAKLQEMRQEAPDRPLLLFGFNAGAALALQVGLAESVSGIVAMGFATNTMNGLRGAPDDHLLDLAVPVCFVVGQNAAKTSVEEVEALREKMHSHTSLIVVGSADDALRIGKTKRQLEGVTQSMVDNMVVDEVATFCKNWLENPVKVKTILAPQVVTINTPPPQPVVTVTNNKKRKSESDSAEKAAKKMGKFCISKLFL